MRCLSSSWDIPRMSLSASWMLKIDANMFFPSPTDLPVAEPLLRRRIEGVLGSFFGWISGALLCLSSTTSWAYYQSEMSITCRTYPSRLPRSRRSSQSSLPHNKTLILLILSTSTVEIHEVGCEAFLVRHHSVRLYWRLLERQSLHSRRNSSLFPHFHSGKIRWALGSRCLGI